MLVDTLLRGVRVCVPDFCGMKAGDRVLDVCCGTGAQTLVYARMGIFSTGIDLAGRMIEFAEKARTRQHLTCVSFHRASAQHLPFKDQCFDYASISMALHEKESPARDVIISEMQRVTKKEGVLVFVDYRVPFPQNAYVYFARFVESIAGSDHFRHFRDYINPGGLDTLLKKNQLQSQKTGPFMKGLLTIVKTRNV
jgi:ubiquinone/menaquinone biosynthesis C-methylase UbiE